MGRSYLKSSADMLRQLLLAAVMAVARGAQLEVTHMTINDAANALSHSCNHDAAYTGSLHIDYVPEAAAGSIEWKQLEKEGAVWSQKRQVCGLKEGKYVVAFRKSDDNSDFSPPVNEVSFSVGEGKTTVLRLHLLSRTGDDEQECHSNATAVAPSPRTGKRTCVCNEHYQGDGFSCEAVNYCRPGMRQCHANAACNYIPGIGNVTCSCNNGFTGSGKRCSPIDFCKSSPCHEHAVCSTSSNGFKCACRPGFEGNGTQCTRIDLCATDANDCSFNASCEAVDGGVECTCQRGFEGNGRFCEKINACKHGVNGGCPNNSSCFTDDDGLRNCVCDAAFTQTPIVSAPGDDIVGIADDIVDPSQVGFECVPTDVCRADNGGCDDNAVCNSTGPGQRSCKCKRTFEGDGESCSPINYCKNGGGCDANALCTPMQGARSCTCNDGYTGDGKLCKVTQVCPTDSNKVGKCRGLVEQSCSLYNFRQVSHSFRCNPAGADPNEAACACRSGFKPTFTSAEGCAAKVLVACEEVDLCKDNNGGCGSPETSTCTKTGPGQIMCGCQNNFRQNFTTGLCEPINACRTNNGNCSQFAKCSMSGPNNRTCSCLEGYSGNGTYCKVHNWCVVKNQSVCSDAHSHCVHHSAGKFSCDCNAGYKRGRNNNTASLCQPIDSCADKTHTCDANADCTPTGPGKFDCQCKYGFQGSGEVCTPIDVCARDNGGCHDDAICKQTGLMNRTCSCKAYFEGDGINCTMIDMCAFMPGYCSKEGSICDTPEPGRMTCSCISGYRQEGPRTCTPIDLCQDNNGGCGSSRCEYTGPGERKCVCPSGFTGSGGDCTVINYCTMNSTSSPDIQGNASVIKRCSKNAKCSPLVLDVKCQCNAGFSGNGQSCESVNPCKDDEGADCKENSFCTHTGPGMHSCTCLSGYTGDAHVSCTAINNCDSEPGVCGENSTCLATGPGVHDCKCEPGYTANKHHNLFTVDESGNVSVQQTNQIFQGMNDTVDVNCRPIDACAVNNGGCDEHTSDCVSTGPGLSSCQCKRNYERRAVLPRVLDSGKVQSTVALSGACVPINRCKQSTDDCSDAATCHFKGPGKFSCMCNTGFTGNGKSCEPVNLCLENNGDCSGNPTCDSTGPGTRSCSCKPHFVGDGLSCQRKDYCAISNGGCDEQASCANGKRLGSVVCKCNKHFQGDGKTCKQINVCEAQEAGFADCEARNAICEHVGPGQFMCHCKGGYLQQNEGKTLHCAPDNACNYSYNPATGRGCPANANCSQTGPGKRTCTCKEGYDQQEGSEGEKCVPRNVCERLNGGCHKDAECTSTGPGTRSCACKPGFYGEDPARECLEPNGCDSNNGGCGNGICKNVHPTKENPNIDQVSCSCEPGFQWVKADVSKQVLANATANSTANGTFAPDKGRCKSINPCEKANGGCDSHAQCTHAGPNKRTCQCKRHYVGDGTVCTPIDYCSKTPNGGCNDNAECISTPGTSAVSCTCNHGYKGDGSSCSVINPCKPDDLKT